MTSSGTYNWTLSNADVEFEAFSRIGKRATELTTMHMIEATRSLNLELQVWGTKGIDLWKVETSVIDLVAPTGEVGQVVYTLPANLLQVLNIRYNIPLSAGGTTDRILLPIGRDDYAAYPTKTLPGTPTVYWFERLLPPQITIWQPDLIGPPNTLTYDWLRQSQDAAASMGQTPDAPNRFLDALCAALATRLARKFAPALVADLKVEAKEAWDLAALDDQEMAPLQVVPDMSGYYR